MLFAIVLGVAALAAAVSRPGRDRGTRRAPSPPLPELAPGPAAPARARLSFSERGRPRRERLRAGRAVTVTVSVREPGQVDVPGLGLTAAAEPLTPARFDVFARRPGRYAVRFTPASQIEARTIGVLRVVPAAKGPAT